MVETEKLHIPVPFRAVPSPRVTWHKDGKELKADERLGFRSVQRDETRIMSPLDESLLVCVAYGPAIDLMTPEMPPHPKKCSTYHCNVD